MDCAAVGSIGVPCAASFGGGGACCGILFADVDLLQRMDRRPVEDRAVDGELRAVAGTIPAALERVPVQMAAEMRACGGMRMHRSVLVAIGCNLLQPRTHDRAVARLD